MCKIPPRVEVLIDNGHPPYCLCCGTDKNLTFDHIYPKSKGGPDCNSNGQILCATCNSTKGSMLLSIPELREFMYIRKIARAIPWYEPYRMTA